MKTKIIPFNKEIAEKIQSGEIKGRIVTKNGEKQEYLLLTVNRILLIPKLTVTQPKIKVSINL